MKNRLSAGDQARDLRPAEVGRPTVLMLSHVLRLKVIEAKQPNRQHEACYAAPAPTATCVLPHPRAFAAARSACPASPGPRSKRSRRSQALSAASADSAMKPRKGESEKGDQNRANAMGEMQPDLPSVTGSRFRVNARLWLIAQCIISQRRQPFPIRQREIRDRKARIKMPHQRQR